MTRPNGSWQQKWYDKGFIAGLDKGKAGAYSVKRSKSDRILDLLIGFASGALVSSLVIVGFMAL